MTKKIRSASWFPVFCSLIILTTSCKAGVPVIQVESPEANLSPALIGVASVFMKINNTGSADDVLISARTEIPGTITELHDIQDGKMVKVEGISIPSNSMVVLRPARLHIMIFKMPKDMTEGAHFNVLLNFKKSGEKSVPVQLTKFAPGTRNHK